MLLDDLTAKAKESPRLRMNLDLRDSAEDSSQMMLNAIEPGSVVPIHRHQKSSETVVCLRGRVVEEYYQEVQGSGFKVFKSQRLNSLKGSSFLLMGKQSFRSSHEILEYA